MIGPSHGAGQGSSPRESRDTSALPPHGGTRVACLDPHTPRTTLSPPPPSSTGVKTLGGERAGVAAGTAAGSPR